MSADSSNEAAGKHFFKGIRNSVSQLEYEPSPLRKNYPGPLLSTRLFVLTFFCAQTSDYFVLGL